MGKGCRRKQERAETEGGGGTGLGGRGGLGLSRAGGTGHRICTAAVGKRAVLTGGFSL